MRSHIRSWAFPLLAIFCSVFFATILAKPTYADSVHTCLSFKYKYTEEVINKKSPDYGNITEGEVQIVRALCAVTDSEDGKIRNLYTLPRQSEKIGLSASYRVILEPEERLAIQRAQALRFEYPDAKSDQGIFHGTNINLFIFAGEYNPKIKGFPVKMGETKREDLFQEIIEHIESKAQSYQFDNEAPLGGGTSSAVPANRKYIFEYVDYVIFDNPQGSPDPKERYHSNYAGKMCRDNAGSFGWVFCPLITELASFLQGAYEEMVEPFLRVDIKLVDRSSGTYQAWEIFRNFANITFVILLLIVLFSQLTGVGIDNYGIKKILPQLIISAVLINLSFHICQFAVDISNIVGNSLSNLLSSIANNLSGSSGVADGMEGVAGGVAALVMGAGATGGAIALYGWALILPVLMGIFSAALAVLLMFILLGIRQALVLVLVVLSPLAFACYVLPGTKKIFDRWLNMLKSALIIYPLSGLLISGGYLVSSIISVSDSDSIVVRVTGLMLMVLPYFLLPNLVKKTFAAIDSVAANIASRGESLRAGAISGVRKSDIYNELRDKGIAGKDGGWRAKFAQTGAGKALGFNRHIGRARARAIATTRERATADNLMRDGYAAGLIAVEKAADKEDLDNRVTKIMSETNNGADEDKLEAMYTTARDSNDISTLKALTEVYGKDKRSAHEFSKLITSDIDSGKLKGNALMSVSKQLSTGANSANYRAGNSIAYEFATQLNSNQIKLNSSTGKFDNYYGWEEKNIEGIMSTHVSSVNDLYSQNKDVLQTFHEYATGRNGKTYVSGAATYLGGLIAQAKTQEARTGIVPDNDKKAMVYGLTTHGSSAFK